MKPEILFSIIQKNFFKNAQSSYKSRYLSQKKVR